MTTRRPPPGEKDRNSALQEIQGRMLPPSELTSLHRVQSRDPFQWLWLEAYNRLRSSQETVFAALSDSMKEKLESFFSESSNEELSEAITSLANTISMNEHPEAAESLKQVIGHRDNIIKVVMTISSHLGLSRPTMGWSCLVVLLEVTVYLSFPLHAFSYTMADN
jgi:hypothetical protein